MHGSIWWTFWLAERLIDLIVPRSAGVIGPLSLLSLRRTSFSSTASSPKSTSVGWGLQSATDFFTYFGGGGVVADGVGTGVGAGAATAAASGTAGLSLDESSQAISAGTSRIA